MNNIKLLIITVTMYSGVILQGVNITFKTPPGTTLRAIWRNQSAAGSYSTQVAITNKLNIPQKITMWGYNYPSMTSGSITQAPDNLSLLVNEIMFPLIPYNSLPKTNTTWTITNQGGVYYLKNGATIIAQSQNANGHSGQSSEQCEQTFRKAMRNSKTPIEKVAAQRAFQECMQEAKRG